MEGVPVLYLFLLIPTRFGHTHEYAQHLHVLFCTTPTMPISRFNVSVREHSGYLRSIPLNTALEWRFTGGSHVTLEGNLGALDDIYCWLEVLGSAWTPHWDEFVRAIFDAWTAIEPNLKPHWYTTLMLCPIRPWPTHD